MTGVTSTAMRQRVTSTGNNLGNYMTAYVALCIWNRRAWGLLKRYKFDQKCPTAYEAKIVEVPQFVVYIFQILDRDESMSNRKKS